MKYQTIEKIYPTLDSIKSVSFKVQIILLKNKYLLKDSFELIQEIKSRIIPNGYIEYHTELKSLFVKYCDETKENTHLPRPETKHEFDKDTNDLKEKYKTVLSQYNINETLYLEFLQEDVEISLYKYSLDDLPDDMDSLSKDEIDVIFEFINN